MAQVAKRPFLSVQRINRLFQEGVLTSQELCQHCFNVAVAGEEIWQLGAIAQLSDTVQQQAAAADKRRKDGKSLSILDGIPITFKENLAFKDLPLTAGSSMLGSDLDTPPSAAGYTADAVQALVDSGAVVLGATRMDEFGMGSLGMNSSKPPSRNPVPFLAELASPEDSDKSLLEWIKSPKEKILEDHETTLIALKDRRSLSYSAGGSSSGCAISVRHGSSLLSIGSDTGGSVRLPAAWCGTVGLKPSYGQISRFGLVGYASSLDCVGILGNSTDCVATAFQSILAKQSRTRDSTLVSSSPNNDNSEIRSSLEGITIGMPEALSFNEIPESTRSSWLRSAQRLEEHGANITTIPSDDLSTELIQNSLAAYYVIASAEASSNLARYDGFRYGVAAPQGSREKPDDSMSFLEAQFARTRSQGFGKEVIRRILCGTAVLSSERFHTYYEAAFRIRAELTEQLDKTLKNHDALLVPTVAFNPPELTSPVDATEALVNDILTVPASLAGLPAISIPSNTPNQGSDFDPSIQLIGRRYEEGRLLTIAQFLS